ncbi:cytochrome c biogenesis protein [Compostibacter hankyongensis]|uniref:Cytochrome c biogenesis protein CcsA n=1 Tax=Compostibacter hankyongensis TaxID=1007089 RepID=A0ABP8FIG7_9BACT
MKYWWKILCVVLLLYTIIGGLLMPVPALEILHETIRNLYYHVTMWFCMLIIFFVSFASAIGYLRNPQPARDIVAVEAARVGLLFGTLGLITGSIWARFTWGEFWSNDPKELCAAIAWLIYLAYFILRNSFTDIDKRARVSAVYNIFAFILMIPVLFVIPRMTDSLHPGNGGNPGFNTYDLDSDLRMVFYPAIVGWTLLGAWLLDLRVRMKKIELNRMIHA